MICQGIIFLLCLTLVACATTPQENSKKLHLTPVDYDALPGWKSDPISEAVTALTAHCPSLIKRSSSWSDFCNQLATTQDNEKLRALFESRLQPYAVASDQGDTGLFTGYYEAELRGAWHRHGRYQTPLYERPHDLITIDLSSFKPDWKGQHITCKIQKNRCVPYDAREKIDQGSLRHRAKVLLWVDDPVDAFFLAIQGSGQVHLADGKNIGVGYDAANGARYVAIGRILADRGEVERPVTMPKIRAWLHEHPKQAPQLMEENPSYVFFRRLTTPAPVGGAALPLTPLRSLAIDTNYISYGTPIWLDTLTASGKPLQRLMIAEDTGGAIKGVVRGDVFWGYGPEAEIEAGSMQSPGKYYLFLPKTDAAQP